MEEHISWFWGDGICEVRGKHNIIVLPGFRISFRTALCEQKPLYPVLF